MRAIAKRFVLRMAATAECCASTLPRNSSATRDDRQVPRDEKRPVRSFANGQWPAVLRQSLACFTYGTVIDETGIVVAVVTERFVVRMPASADRRAKLRARHVIGHILNIEITANMKRAIVSDDDCVFVVCCFLYAAVLDRESDGAGRASLYDSDHFVDVDLVWLTPGFTSADEQFALGSTTFLNMNAEPPVPGYIGILTFVSEGLLVTHRVFAIAKVAGIMPRGEDLSKRSPWKSQICNTLTTRPARTAPMTGPATGIAA